MMDSRSISAGQMLLVLMVLLVVVNTMIGTATAIKCYSCSIETCPKFNETDPFEIDCPHSTMCLKRIYPYELNNGKMVETFERGCANQLSTDKVYKDHSWADTNRVEEPYEEGCAKLRKNSDTIYCHCRGSLCNSAPSTKDTSSYHTDAMAVIFVFNAMKYLRSME